MILLISHHADEHGDAVAQRLEKMEAGYVRMAPTELGEHLYCIDPLSPNFGGGQLLQCYDSERTEAQTYNAIWWRRPRKLEDHLRLTFPLAEEIAAAEAYHAFRLACEALPLSFFPLGHPDPMDSSANKLLQLRVAQRVGFTVPETLVGNDPARHREFLKRHPRVVVKPLHANAVYAEHDRSTPVQQLWCRGFDAEALMTRLQGTRPVQLMLQAAVPKVRDWRITVLPHITFCCAIDSSQLPPNEPDFRKHTMSLPHEMIPVTPEFEAQLRRFLHAFDLPAGYFDFAVTADGRPVFLECNTNAQWLWIERLTGAAISEEIAKCLVAGGM